MRSATTLRTSYGTSRHTRILRLYHHLPPTSCWINRTTTTSRMFQNNNIISSLSSSSSPFQPQQHRMYHNSTHRKQNESTTTTVEDDFSSSSSLLYMWGTDTKGSLLPENNVPKGTNSSNTVPMYDVPKRIEHWQHYVEEFDQTSTVESVICGPTNTALLLSNGTCYVCGENKHGELGQGHTNPVGQLTKVILPFYQEHLKDGRSKNGIQQVALGNQFAAYVDKNGDLYTCGYGGSAFNGMGFLSHGNARSYHTPTLVESLIEDGCSVQKVVVGESHMTVLTTEGEVLTCGAGSYGRLGNFETHVDVLYLHPVEILTPEMKVIDIVGGKSFTLALTTDGVVVSSVFKLYICMESCCQIVLRERGCHLYITK
jgi:alpha-tubulin suppressor-like RCC1 family protein